MPFIITKLSQEPIVITSWMLPLHEHIEDIKAINRRIARLLKESSGPVYRIVNASQMGDLSFSDIHLWLAEQSHNAPGSITDPRVRTVFVGGHQMVQSLVQKAERRTGLTFPHFATLDEAISYARKQIALQQDCPSR